MFPRGKPKNSSQGSGSSARGKPRPHGPYAWMQRQRCQVLAAMHITITSDGERCEDSVGMPTPQGCSSTVLLGIDSAAERLLPELGISFSFAVLPLPVTRSLNRRYCFC